MIYSEDNSSSPYADWEDLQRWISRTELASPLRSSTSSTAVGTPLKATTKTFYQPGKNITDCALDASAKAAAVGEDEDMDVDAEGEEDDGEYVTMAVVSLDKDDIDAEGEEDDEHGHDHESDGDGDTASQRSISLSSPPHSPRTSLSQSTATNKLGLNHLSGSIHSDSPHDDDDNSNDKNYGYGRATRAYSRHPAARGPRECCGCSFGRYFT